jgi:hypothetical protein
MKWGIDFRRVRDDLLQTQTFNPRGVFRYGPGLTSCRTDCSAGTANSFANSFASFLLDLPRQVGRDLAEVFPAWRQWQYFLYFHDKWQISPKVTLDLGLRWEYYQPATPRFAGGFSNYDPVANRLLLAGLGSIPMDLGFRKNLRNFAPRGGISYRLNEKTVLRAGFGISFVPFPDNTYAYNFPVKQNNSYNQTSTFTPSVTPAGQIVNLASGFPPPQPVAFPSSGIIENAALAQNYDHINPNFKEGYVESWNVAVQRSLPSRFVLDVAYVANHGVKVPSQYQLNAGLLPGAGANGRPLFQRFGKSADVNMRFFGTSSNYHSMQVKFDRRFSGGFLLTSAYTWSKSMGYTDENGGLAYYINPERSRSELGFSRRHSFAQSYVYELPFGRGKKLANTGVAAAILGGWQVNGILTMMTGNRLNFGASGAALNAPGNAQSPNVSGPIRVLHGIDNDFWFDTSNFSNPAALSFGNLGRNVIAGPGFFNLDASIFRTFRIREKLSFEFRSEWFSATNTAQFSNPDTTLGNANFGKIKGTRGTDSAGTTGGNRSGGFGIRILF